MAKIKFGTDGWRAVIAQDFTVEQLKKIAEATAIWMQAKGLNKVVIGYDTRFGGKLFAETAARVLAAYQIKINMTKSFVTTPMVSLGVLKTKSDLGIMITAGHNASAFNGYKIRSADGSPITPTDIIALEALIPRQSNLALPDMHTIFAEGLLNYFDLEQLYMEHIRTHINLDAIRSARIKIAYDAMFGAGMKLIQRLLPDALFLHCEENPAIPGRIPDPIPANLGELAMLVTNTPEIDCGLATSSDASRLGMYDSDGNFIDANHLLLLLLSYLKVHKKLTGQVVTSCATTHKMQTLAKHYGLDHEVTKVGFQHIIKNTAMEKIVIAGEESGGIATAGHIPDRDGIWAGLLMLEFMAITGKSLKTLVAEVYDKAGMFCGKRKDIKISKSQMQTILQHYAAHSPSTIGHYTVRKIDKLDGYKFFFNDETWVMLRPSRTEAILRIYAQARTQEEAKRILDTMVKTISGIGRSVQHA